jgi:hypothetical protein
LDGRRSLGGFFEAGRVMIGIGRILCRLGLHDDEVEWGPTGLTFVSTCKRCKGVKTTVVRLY